MDFDPRHHGFASAPGRKQKPTTSSKRSGTSHVLDRLRHCVRRARPRTTPNPGSTALSFKGIFVEPSQRTGASSASASWNVVRRNE